MKDIVKILEWIEMCQRVAGQVATASVIRDARIEIERLRRELELVRLDQATIEVP